MHDYDVVAGRLERAAEALASGNIADCRATAGHVIQDLTDRGLIFEEPFVLADGVSTVGLEEFRHPWVEESTHVARSLIKQTVSGGKRDQSKDLTCLPLPS